MENLNVVFIIGMDTYKESTDVAYSLDGRENKPITLR